MLGWETLDNKLSIQTFTTQAYDSNSNVNDELVGAPDPSFETLDHIDPDVWSSFLIGDDKLTSDWLECSFTIGTVVSGSGFTKVLDNHYEYTVQESSTDAMNIQFEVEV